MGRVIGGPTGPQSVLQAVGRAVIGQSRVAEFLLATAICGGHALIEDVPGTGKTSLALAMAAAIGCRLGRIQFTPDLTPADVTGMSVFDPRSGEFVWKAGPVFTEFLLADEINRASPRTQSALLEAMAEGAVTADGTSRPLPVPFCVLATQNPVELEGTFPLPEAQLDRFFVRLRLGYLTGDDERIVLDGALERGGVPAAVRPVARRDDLLLWRSGVVDVEVHPDLRAYCVQLVRATREMSGVRLGASLRGTVALARLAQGLAFVRGRRHVTPDDVQEAAGPVLGHRLLLDDEARLNRLAVHDLVSQAVRRVPVPA